MTPEEENEMLKFLDLDNWTEFELSADKMNLSAETGIKHRYDAQVICHLPDRVVSQSWSGYGSTLDEAAKDIAINYRSKRPGSEVFDVTVRIHNERFEVIFEKTFAGQYL